MKSFESELTIYSWFDFKLNRKQLIAKSICKEVFYQESACFKSKKNVVPLST